MKIRAGETLEIRIDARLGRGYLMVGPWLIRLEQAAKSKPSEADRWKVTAVEQNPRGENY